MYIYKQANLTEIYQRKATVGPHSSYFILAYRVQRNKSIITNFSIFTDPMNDKHINGNI